MMNDILLFFPNKIAKILEEKLNKLRFNQLEEIRIRTNKKIILRFNYKEEIINYIISAKDILEILQIICENSIYSYQKEIVQGYITVKGGHRVGITGNCIIENRRNHKYKLHIKFKL